MTEIFEHINVESLNHEILTSMADTRREADQVFRYFRDRYELECNTPISELLDCFIHEADDPIIRDRARILFPYIRKTKEDYLLFLKELDSL